jgi:hypothetical protein
MNIIGEVPGTLEAGQTVEIRVQHVVTAADAANGTVRNEVTAKIGDLEKKGEDTVETVLQYRLTVNYWIGTTPAAESFTNVYDSGDTYAVTSPTILGYTADQARVTGTITADTTLNVYYTVNSYNLTVNYVYMDGSQAAQTYTAAVAYGTAYSVTSPAVEGFTPNNAVVEGTMPARDVIHTVIYTAIPAPAQPDAPAVAPAAAPAVEHIPLVILEDYDTPLGIPNLSLCAGEEYE